jgi:Restriction endonuclease
MTRPSHVTVPRGDPSTWGQVLDMAELAAHLDLCRAPAPTTREKGQRLEQLAIWLLPHLPGFRVRIVDFFSADHAQEIDLLIWNEQMQGGFPSFGEKIIVECKNWERPVDSSDIAWFYWKMRLGGVREGILIAANGVTGEMKRRRAAQGILTAANADDPARKIFVVTLSEIAGLTSYTELRELLIDKSLKLTGQDALP